MLPYDIGLKEGSDPEVTKEQRREERLNALADKEHEAIQRQTANESHSAHTAQPPSSSSSSASSAAATSVRSPEPDPMGGDGPTPAPLLGALHSSNTAANSSQSGSAASVTANSADSIQH